MESKGLRPDQVAKVIGYADQSLLNPNDPLDTANRRISILVRFLTTPAEAAAQSADSKTGPSAGLRTGVPDKPSAKGRSAEKG
jgi:chemotaxis protein MotB